MDNLKRKKENIKTMIRHAYYNLN